MDSVHKQRIDQHIETLVNETHYERLIRSIERVNKSDVITEALLTKWKERPRFGWSCRQSNSEFYSEIQKRGPNAYQLLIECLKDSGHYNLACTLDPSISTEQDEDEEQIHQEYYSNEGKHFYFLGSNWKKNVFHNDGKALQSFFKDQGYQEFMGDLEDVGSLIVINFCLFSNGEVPEEDDWVYKGFQSNELHGKPKVLISLRYNRDVETNQDIVEQDSSGTIKKLFRDILHIKIYLDGSTRGTSSGISEEVKHMIRIFAAEDSLHFEDKVQKLAGEFKKHGIRPLVKHKTYFSKGYRLKKKN